MKYTASLDTLGKIITSGTIILLLILGYKSANNLTSSMTQGDTVAVLMNSGILLLFIATIVGCYLYAPKSYLLDSDSLTIVRPANNKKILLSDITEVRAIEDSEMTLTIRTFGVGGLFGYFGKYRNSKIGSMTFYATQRKNRILIQTKQGEKIIITPDDTSIIDALKTKTAAFKTNPVVHSGTDV